MRQKNICPSIYRNNKYSYVRKCKVVALRVVLFLRQFCATRGAGNQHVTKSYESAVVFFKKTFFAYVKKNCTFDQLP